MDSSRCYSREYIIGQDVDPGDREKLYFQDYSSYRKGIRYVTDSTEEEAIYQNGVEKRIFDYEKALDVLLGCSLRRAKAAGGSSIRY